MPRPSKAKSLDRLNAVGVENLLDDLIKPRAPLYAFGPRIKRKNFQEDGPVLPLAQYDDALVHSLDMLAQATDDYTAVKRALVAEVHWRHTGMPKNPTKNIREVIASDVYNVIMAHKRAKGQKSPPQWGFRVRNKSEQNDYTASLPQQPLLQNQASASEEEHHDFDASSDELEVYETPGRTSNLNERPDDDELRQMQNEPGETTRITVFYPIRETSNAQDDNDNDDDTSFSLDDILSLANSATATPTLSAFNTRVNMKILPIQHDATTAADAAFEKTDKLVRSLIHLDSFVPMAESMLQVPTRKLPEVLLMGAMSQAGDAVRQAMHDAEGSRSFDAIERAREAQAAYERAEFEWRRNVVARLAQMQMNDLQNSAGLVLSSKLKGLFESVLL
ncbi:hypothetical protein IWZ03DRAFT_441657 [Phyllosticta citriasiana]|uniref:Uncharacterized protein n=1 Tax=Phyllosticta citriasiana TaxID=595635 RepID=A0ABR1KL58_9PEZI